MSRRVPLIVLALIPCLSVCLAEESQPSSAMSVMRRPSLALAPNWLVDPAAASTASILQIGDRLAIDLADSPDVRETRLLLTEPIEVPTGSNGFTCVIHSLGGPDKGVTPRLIIEDASGAEFFYDLRSRALGSREYWPNNLRAKPIRLYTPGLDRPVVRPRAGMNIAPVDPASNARPVPPLKIKGLQLARLGWKAAADQRRPSSTLRIFWGDFAFTNLSWRESVLYYSITGNEHYGEIEPLPAISLGDLGPVNEGVFSVGWELRDRFDGPPFATGGASFNIAAGDPLAPLRRLEFPVREKGTYWIAVKRRWTDGSRPPARSVETREFRLDIVRGRPPLARSPLATPGSPFSTIQIAPGRASCVFSQAEKFVVPISLKPDSQGGPFFYRLEARRSGESTPVKTAKGQITGNESIDFDLDDLSPCAYIVKAELLSGDTVIDRSQRLVGRLAPEAAPAPIPPSVFSWREQLVRRDSFIRLQPNGYEDHTDPARRWRSLETFVNEAAGITREVEFIIRWKDVEALPGVYDWSETDRFLDRALAKGVSVLLWPSFAGSEPAWIPAWFEEPRNKAGNIFNALPYTFQGGRINYLHSREAREATLRFLRAMAIRYRGHPAVSGYYVLTEHPHDMPALGWLVGGSQETRSDFAGTTVARLGSLDKINTRWGTTYRDASQIDALQPDASPRQRMDWLAFLSEANDRYLLDMIRQLRAVDDHRLIQTYIGAGPRALLEMKSLGCMVADGGSQNPETFGAESMSVAELGLQRRAEEVTVGYWSQMFPSQLDATLFTMLLGGGGNSNCKMFIPVDKPLDELRRGPRSLDRFEKFIPIWNELRAAKPFPREVFSLFETEANLLQTGTTIPSPDAWDNMVAMESGLAAPAMPATFATKGRLLLVGSEHIIEKSVLGTVSEYVRKGGTLVIRADSGRTCPDLPGEDWTLLRAFGFTPPAGDVVPGTCETVPVKGDVFPDSAASFRLREYWPASPGADERVIATLASSRKAAVTWKPFGAGRVVVVWASTIVPSRGSSSYPFLRDIARWAGVAPRSGSGSTAIWTNLLRTDSGDVFYGLAYHSAWQIRDKPPVSARVTWSLPAPGRYRVTELISGKDHGIHDADALTRDGLEVTLPAYGVSVFRLQKTATP
ncbi:MAG TPA: beta-galactosidase [Rariglobus sp.]